MIRQLLILFLLFLVIGTYAQQPFLQWADHFRGQPSSTGDEYILATSIQTDQNGNLYSTGRFNNAVDFDPGPGIFILNTSAASQPNVFISKLNDAGALLWVKKLDIREIEDPALALDRHGNVYITGKLKVLTDMDPGPGIHTIAPIGSSDAFILKLDPQGNFLWVKQFGGTAEVPVGLSITIDAYGDIIFGGHFNRTIDLDPGPQVYNLDAVTTETFIAKLTSNGDFIWAKQVGKFTVPGGNVSLRKVVCDPMGNIFLTGIFHGTADFDPGSPAFIVTSTGSVITYILKLSITGDFIWVKTIDDMEFTGGIYPNGIDIDFNNNVYVTGFYHTQHTNYDFDPGPAVFTLPELNESQHMFLLKLDQHGNFVWAKNWGANGPFLPHVMGIDVAVDAADDVYVMAKFYGSGDYDPGPAVVSYNLSTLGFIKLTSGGVFIAATPFLSPTSGSVSSAKITTDVFLNVFVSGSFGGEVDFDPGLGVTSYNASDRTHGFSAKYSRCMGMTSSTISASTCSSFTLNSQSYETPGIFTQILPNANGCDSLIILDLNIEKIVTNRNEKICQGEYFFAGGSNQTQTGIYRDTLQTVNGCDSIIVTSLSVNILPVIDIGADGDLCQGEDRLLQESRNYPEYLWSNGSVESHITVNTAGIYSLTVTDEFGCKGSDTVKVENVWPLPTGFLGPDSSICKYSTLELHSLKAFPQYLWSNGNTASAIKMETPGVYWLQVTDQHGCSNRDSVEIFLKDCMKGLYVPAAFTPNGDAKNDQLRALLFGNIQSFEFSIYNRYGQMIFKTRDPLKGWDGIINGIKQGSGNFVWICRYRINNEPERLEKGSSILIR